MLEEGDTPAGIPLHDILIRLIADESLLIHDASATLAASPFDVCREAATGLAPLKGLRIGPGWNQRVRELLGGAASCTHIMEMLGPIATTVFQGLASQRLARMTQPGNDVHKFKIDSAMRTDGTGKCWRGYGPDLQKRTD